MTFFQQISPDFLQSLATGPAGITFRLAEASDLKPLYRACHEEQPLLFWKARFFYALREQAAGRRLFVVAQITSPRSTTLVGSAQLVGYTGGVAEISDLVVSPKARGRGIGSALIGLLTQLAEKTEISTLEIGVLASNERALTLYRRLGFREARELKVSAREKAIILEKELAPPR